VQANSNQGSLPFKWILCISKGFQPKNCSILMVYTPNYGCFSESLEVFENLSSLVYCLEMLLQMGCLWDLEIHGLKYFLSGLWYPQAKNYCLKRLQM
jgi:hypothetical protein